MIKEWDLRNGQGGISRRSLWFVFAGMVVTTFDIAIFRWTLTLSQPFGEALWTAILALGLVLILYSSFLPRIPPPLPSKVYTDRIETWENSGELVTIVNNLSREEAVTLLLFTKRHFGEYVHKTGTTPKGKTWTVKLLRVGYRILPPRPDEGKLMFSVILFRRDLARQKGVRRPWREISRTTNALEYVKPGPLIALPNWIAN